MLQNYRNTLMITIQKNVSRVMRKPAFCICGNKRRRSAAQLLRSGSTHTCAFATKTAQFSTSMYGPVCVGPGREPEDRFNRFGDSDTLLIASRYWVKDQ